MSNPVNSARTKTQPRATAITASQPILAHDGGKVVAIPASHAWPRLQALHRQALREGSKADVSGVSSPRPIQSKYAHSLSAALGQFATSHPELRNSMFESLVNHVDATGSMDGLESLYASGLTDAGQRQTPLLARAARTAKTVGWPAVAGGGFEHSLHFDPQRGTLTTVGSQRFGGFIPSKTWGRKPNTQGGPGLTLGGQTYSGVSSGSAPSQIEGPPDLTTTPTELDPNELSGGIDPGDVLGPAFQDLGSNEPNASNPDPNQRQLGNPGERGFQFKVPGQDGLSPNDFYSFGGKLGPLAKNPGHGSPTVNMPGESKLQQIVDASKKLGQGNATWFDAHGHGLGPHGSGHVVLPSGKTGDPGSEDLWDDIVSLVSGIINAPDPPTRNPRAPSNPRQDHTPLHEDPWKDVVPSAPFPRPPMPSREKRYWDYGDWVEQASIGGPRPGGASNPDPNSDGNQGVGPRARAESGEENPAPDSNAGAGIGPRATPNERPADQGSGPVNPHARSAFTDTGTPAPDNNSGPGIGPRAREVGMEQQLTDMYTPNPEGNAPGSPHSREL